ncbi:hypothetical protein BGZ57DRAFT_898540 [Hyaloscypha finlandica]|nr:hypothetical protein BGZ57DRAFT_898540 [Hyaloscypha finlandica]
MAPISQSTALSIAANIFGVIFIGFGINAILRPIQALEFFEFDVPSLPADRKVVESLSVVYGVRDIFMGMAINIVAYCGQRKVAGWILIAASAVAFADGAVCYMHGKGEWNHWGYAPMLTVVGSVLVGILDKV